MPLKSLFSKLLGVKLYFIYKYENFYEYMRVIGAYLYTEQIVIRLMLSKLPYRYIVIWLHNGKIKEGFIWNIIRFLLFNNLIIKVIIFFFFNMTYFKNICKFHSIWITNNQWSFNLRLYLCQLRKWVKAYIMSLKVRAFYW